MDLDQRTDVGLAQWTELDSTDASRAALDRLQGRPKRMRAGEGVGLVRPDEQEREVPRGSSQERHEVARCCIDLVQILEKHDNRAVGAESADEGAQRLERSVASPLRASRPCGIDRRHPGNALEEGAQELGGRPDERGDPRWR
ncbi:MAG TPA: hypothetical protein VF341_09690, partial [Anaeromyxobacteraceae bacterium]